MFDEIDGLDGSDVGGEECELILDNEAVIFEDGGGP